jgi:hypothetical protein
VGFRARFALKTRQSVICRVRSRAATYPLNRDNQAELIGKLMDALAAELGQLKNQPARRAELVQQIRYLSRLCRAMKTGEDSSLEDR